MECDIALSLVVQKQTSTVVDSLKKHLEKHYY